MARNRDDFQRSEASRALIPLILKVQCDARLPAFVVRISNGATRDEGDSVLVTRDAEALHYNSAKANFQILNVEPEDVQGDVLLIEPSRQLAYRLIRAASNHNTFLITEQCDQLCVMCSQPPKAHHDDLFEHFLSAVLLAPGDIEIGLSGGEPLLHKDALFKFLNLALDARKDVKFHILTNAQHFEESDLAWLRRNRARLLWGIPIYSANAEAHDLIVGKVGAFKRLTRNLALLGLSGSAVELRTVLMKQNAADLPQLADFISRHLPFSSTWAIMQMERIGYGRMNWEKCFFDNSIDFGKVACAIDIMLARRQHVQLYNFPLCTVPDNYQKHLVKSISDWKQKYLKICATCSKQSRCGGFFEWYMEKDGFVEINPK